jgi:hypothetical protein
VDLMTDDLRAWTLAPHLVVVGSSAVSVDWMDTETGTTCHVDRQGEYAVLRRVGARVAPVETGQIPVRGAVSLVADPESVHARRAAADAILAVSGDTVRR